MMKKIVMLIFGTIFLILGIVGIILPVIPQIPFLLVSFFFFSRSSDRIERWFKNSTFYKKYLREIVEKKQVSKKQVLIAVLMTSVSLGIALWVYISFFA